MKTAFPDAELDKIKAAIMVSANCTDGLVGKTMTDGRLDIDQAIKWMTNDTAFSPGKCPPKNEKPSKGGGKPSKGRTWRVDLEPPS